METIFQSILNFALSKGLFYKNQNIGIGVSGGSDSVVLFYFFNAIKELYNLNLVTLHFNHKIRLESDKDEEFVKNLSITHGIKFYSQSQDVKLIANKNKKNLEDQARILRYSFFEQSRKQFTLDKIATAHHKNDLIETFIINLIRGSSLDGVTSLKSHRNFYIRPMLCLEKTQILDFLKNNNLLYSTDITNFDTAYKRNKIRLNLMETLKAYNPNIVSSLYRHINFINEDEMLLSRLAFENFINSTKVYVNKAIINTDILSSDFAIKSRVIKMSIKKISNTFYSQSFANIKRVIEVIETGKLLVLRKQLKAYKQQNYLIIEKI